MITRYPDNINDRKAAVLAGLAAALPTRIVRGSPIDHRAESTQDLLTGMAGLISDGEREYANDFARTAKEPVHRFLIGGLIQVAQDATKDELGTAEGELIEEIKAFWRAGLPGMSFRAVSITQSRLLDFPLGWVVAVFDVLPPQANLTK